MDQQNDQQNDQTPSTYHNCGAPRPQQYDEIQVGDPASAFTADTNRVLYEPFTFIDDGASRDWGPNLKELEASFEEEAAKGANAELLARAARATRASVIIGVRVARAWETVLAKRDITDSDKIPQDETILALDGEVKTAYDTAYAGTIAEEYSHENHREILRSTLSFWRYASIMSKIEDARVAYTATDEDLDTAYRACGSESCFKHGALVKEYLRRHPESDASPWHPWTRQQLEAGDPDKPFTHEVNAGLLPPYALRDDNDAATSFERRLLRTEEILTQLAETRPHMLVARDARAILITVVRLGRRLEQAMARAGVDPATPEAADALRAELKHALRVSIPKGVDLTDQERSMVRSVLLETWKYHETLRASEQRGRQSTMADKLGAVLRELLGQPIAEGAGSPEMTVYEMGPDGQLHSVTPDPEYDDEPLPDDNEDVIDSSAEPVTEAMPQLPPNEA